jgi:hypothetical protein
VWACPRCGQWNDSTSEICAQCRFWGDSPAWRPAPHPASLETRGNGPASEGPPDLALPSAPAEIAPAGPVARGSRRGDPSWRHLWWTWAALGAVGLLGAAVGVGWWWGSGTARAAVADLQTAEAALARLQAHPSRQTPARPAASVPARGTPSAPTTTATAPAVWQAGGTWGPATPITLTVVLVNPANGRHLTVTGVVDTGSYVTLLSLSQARALGLATLGQSAIGGVGDPDSSTVIDSAVWFATPQGQVLWRLRYVQASSYVPDGLLIGRDVLDQAGLSLTTVGDQWTLRLARWSLGAEGAPATGPTHVTWGQPVGSTPATPSAPPVGPAPANPSVSAPFPASCTQTTCACPPGDVQVYTSDTPPPLCETPQQAFGSGAVAPLRRSQP